MTNGRHVALGTISFTVCFAAWGLIGAFAPRFRELFHLAASETALLVAVPVLLGSLARIPMGILTDRFGGRAIFTILMAAVAVPVWIVPSRPPIRRCSSVAFLLGLGGSSFAIGVGYVSRWTPADRQGSALGVYGLGNIGQSAAVFLGPVLAARVGMASVYHGVAVLLVVWAVAFALLARNAPAAARPRSARASARCSRCSRARSSPGCSSAFYFLTFGGFVAFSIYLPTLLKDEFHLTPADAGFRTAGFVVLATLLRPAGRLARRPDRRRARAVGGLPRRRAVRAAAGLAGDDAVHRRRARLRGAARARQRRGLQAGARSTFPTQTGTVTGLVGAMGGLGGFFPPLLLGVLPQPHRARSGPASCCWPRPRSLLWWANHRVFVPRQQALDLALPADLRRTADRLRAGAWATLWTALLVAAIVVGSRNLQNFDPALVIYTFAVVFATWGVVYHYNVWLEKPPTRVYWDRGWELYRAARASSAAWSASSRSPRRTWSRSASSRSARGCAGGCTSASSGAACWRWRSRSRWSSAGSTSAPLPGDQLTLRHLPVRLPGRLVPPAHRDRVAALPRPRHLGGAGARRASRSRSGAA